MILSNQIKCMKCEDIIYSAHRHDYVTCKCGAVSVDGGTDYIRRIGRLDNIEELSIFVSDSEYQAMVNAVEWADKTGRNTLGLICAIVRAQRDGKFDGVS